MKLANLPLVLAFLLAFSGGIALAEKPNFVVILTDDQGYGDLSCYGGKHISTPRIDQMAAEGKRLTSFYVAAPVCTPSRAGLMTGCYPKRIDMATGSKFGVLLAGDKKGLNPDEITIAEVLKGAGYKTGMFGKWHLGDQPAFMPTRQGFDEFFGIPYSHDIHPFHPRQSHYKFPPLPLLDGEEVIEMDPDADFLTRRFTERAVKFIETNKDEPFFLYVPHPIPHAPLHVSPPFMEGVAATTLAKLEAEKNGIDYRARDEIFRQAIAEIDWSVGQILDALKANGVDENTCVLFTSDNGPPKRTLFASPGILRGNKGTTLEGGMREPTVVRWPGVIPAGGDNDELMTAMDLLPTFAKLAGTEPPADRVIDGKDVSAVLRGEAENPHEAFFYHQANALAAVRSGDWKLHVKGGKPTALYDLATDVAEKKNVRAANPEVVKKLLAQIKDFERELMANRRPAAFVKNPKPLRKVAAAKPNPELGTPNVVFIFADDLGYGDLGCYGATKIKTPHIDSLARDGRRFTDAHSASAVCTPSRYALLTGEYPLRSNGGKGTWGPLSPRSGLIIDTNTQTIGKTFQDRGYATACLGKWHLGFKTGVCDWLPPLRPGPLELGFDHYFGLPLVNSGSPFVYVEDDTIIGFDPADPLVYGKKPISPTPMFPPEASRKSPNRFGGALKAHKIYDDEKTGTMLAERAVKWITDNKDDPFFLYFPVPHIHHPFTPAPRFKGTSECGYYGDFIHELDWMVGEILGCLEDNGLSDDTLVIFTSDNGGMLNRAGRDAMKAGHKINGDLLGFKFGVWEGGHRVPFIARWPGKIKAGTESDQLLCQVDMLATFTALTGADPQALKGKDSINMLPALLEDPAEPLRSELVLAPRQPRNLALRQGKWMYIGNRGSGGFTGSKPTDHAWGGPPAVQFAGGVNSDIENGRVKKNAPATQLYDLEKDPGQTKNVVRQFPQVAKRMAASLTAIRSNAAKATNAAPQKGQGAQSKPPPAAPPQRPLPNARIDRPPAPPNAPNVVFILTDDLGYSDVGCYGATKIKTPHIDRLAANGMRFTDFHSAASICSPSRAAFLTGAYPQRAGLYMGINPKRTAHWFLGLHPDEITLAELFQSKGYATHMVGKWHLGTEPEFLPGKQGFETYYGMPCNFSHSPAFLDGDHVVFEKTPLNRLTELYTKRVVRIIREHRDRAEPFFLYYAHNYPHTPYAAGERFKGSSKDGVRGDIMQELDWSVGEMMKALEQAGVADNTIVIFTSDNGPTKNEYAQPYRGTKYVTFEGGHRVPFVVHWPAAIAAGRSSAVNVNAMDLFPTLADIIGAPLPSDRVYDGESLLPLFEGKPLQRAESAPLYYYNCENLQAVRRGDWKLHLPRSQQQLPFWDRNKAFVGAPGPALFHLGKDPAESTDVAAQHPQVVEQLRALAESARGDLGEFMQRGTAQRPTGSLFPDAPVISHEKDWGTVKPGIVDAIAQERAKRHPLAGAKTTNKKAK